MFRKVLIALAVCAVHAGCGGERQEASLPVNGNPRGGAPGGDQSGLTAELLRDTSGAPSGIRVSWEPVSGVAGYNLYRMDQPIPDSERGSTVNRVNEVPIPNVEAPETVVYDDLFPVSVGEEWHYRVSSVDDTGDESDLSPESALTISDFIVTRLVTTSAGVGEPVEIEGENFGGYDTAVDKVYFFGARALPGGGLEEAWIEATVTDWQLYRITCTVPDGATRGQVRIESNGLTQDTPEEFVNSDPYIQSIDPASGNTDDVVTVTGGNFGATQDATHRLFLEGQALPAVQYVSYSDTEVQFKPLAANAPQSFVNLLPVQMRIGTRGSNTAQFDLINRPPVAGLTVTPLDGDTPLTVDFDASASFDPDNGDFVLYAWDFDGDGIPEDSTGFDPGATHTYDLSGDYRPAVFVSDSSAAIDSAGVDLNVALSPLALEDNGTFAPGSVFFQDDMSVYIAFKLSGGEPQYAIDWYLIGPDGTETLLAQDAAVSYGTNLRAFPIDTTTDTPDPTAGTIPFGTWSLRAEASDGGTGNDPDPARIWPSFANGQPGTFTVYRYDVVLVRDEQGDPNGNESTALGNMLVKLGYRTTQLDSKGLQFQQLQIAPAVIWAADGSYGSRGVPYGWLDTRDLSLMKQYLDGQGSLILLGPPFEPGNNLADDDFRNNYQPFARFSTNQGTSLDLHSFSAQHAHTVDSCLPGGVIGDDEGNNLLGGTVHGDFLGEDGLTARVLASRQSPGGGTLYFGMFVFSSIQETQPKGSTVDQLLDNIVAGSIEN